MTYDITHKTEQDYGDEYDHTSVAEGLSQAKAVQWLNENVAADLLYQFYVSEIDEDGLLGEQDYADEWLAEIAAQEAEEEETDGGKR